MKTGFDDKLATSTFSRVLVFGDTHSPYNHPDTIPFLRAVRDLVQPDLVVNLGDELDYHAMSFHDTDPDLDGAGVELLKGRAFLHNLEKVFPEMYIVHSNHGSMKYRKAVKHGFPKHLIMSYSDTIFGERANENEPIYRPNDRGKGWVWKDKVIFKTNTGQDVLCVHGQLQNAIANIQRNQMCYIQGHYHSSFEVRYTSTPYNLLWGMTCGCLIDDESLAFEYNKLQAVRPIIGCGAVINGQPKLIPMVLKKGGRWTGEIDAII